MKKPWWKSRTIWLNIISIAVEVIMVLSDAKIVPVGTVSVITNLLNIGLRKLTTEPIK